METNSTENIEWEIMNKENIAGWEIHYGYENEKKKWEWYDGYKIVIYKMKDKSKVEWKIIE